MIGVIIPTLNEEEAIKEVIEDVPNSINGENTEIIVIDGGSDDRTVEIAEDTRAEVIRQKYKGGKGSAMREAFDSFDYDIYVFLDGDGTYNASEMDKIVSPIQDGSAEQVIGVRTEGQGRKAIPLLNRFGQYLFNRFVSFVYGERVEDMLSGYRAISGDVVDDNPLMTDGFGIETEMTLSTLDSDARMKYVDVHYMEREGDSKLHPVKDGFNIMRTIVVMARDARPFMFFSSLSLIFFLLSIYPAFKAVKQKVLYGVITHVAPVVAATLFLIFSLQTFLFGLIADQQRNNMRRLKKLINSKGSL